MTPVRLEPAALRSRVKHSTTEPLRSLFLHLCYGAYRKKICILDTLGYEIQGPSLTHVSRIECPHSNQLNQSISILRDGGGLI